MQVFKSDTMAQSKRAARKPAPELPFHAGLHGGPRPGAGRPRARKRRWVPRVPRAPLASRYPVHVTQRLRPGLPSLRRKATYLALRLAFAAGSSRPGFRLVHYSIQPNHLHLIVEAKDRDALARGMQGLSIRVAKALNRLWERAGSVFADRYHDRILRTPREVRNVLCYVLHNDRHHRYRAPGVDPFTSGAWFDGWREPVHAPLERVGPAPVARARTWLLRSGWRRHGRLSFDEVPGG